eukprot:6430540-Prymnesium_polylepis.1
MPRTPPGWEPAGARLRVDGEQPSSPIRLPPPALTAANVPDAVARRRLTLPRTPPEMRHTSEGAMARGGAERV